MLQWSLLLLVVVGLELLSGLMTVVHPLMPAIAIGLICVVILSLINSNIGTAALIFAIPLAYGSFNLNITETYTLDAVHAMLICLIILQLIVGGARGEYYFSATPLDRYFFLFLLWATVSLTWAPNLFTAVVHLLLLFSVYFFYYVAYYCMQDQKSLEYAIWGWWSVGFFFSLVGLLQYLGMLGIEITYKTDMAEGYSRVIGFSGSPSAFAGIMLLCFFTMVGGFQYFAGAFQKTLMAIAAFLSLLTIILTLSRSAFIGLFAGMLLFSATYLRRFFLKYLLFLTLVTTVFVLFGIVSGIDFEGRLSSILSFYKQGAWMIRLAVWAASLKMFLDTYALGTGLGGMEVLFKNYFHHPFPVGDVPPHAHSLYIDVLTHFGLIGFILFVALIGKTFFYFGGIIRKAGNTPSTQLLWALCCGLSAIAIQVLITERVHVPKIWIFLGMTMGCARLIEQQQAVEDPAEIAQR